MNSQNAYATSFPLVSSGVVTDGHVRYCREHGHATYKLDGVLQNFCPRCGDPLDKDDAVATEPTRPALALEPIEVEGKTAEEVAEQVEDRLCKILWRTPNAGGFSSSARGLDYLLSIVAGTLTEVYPQVIRDEAAAREQVNALQAERRTVRAYFGVTE